MCLVITWWSHGRGNSKVSWVGFHKHESFPTLSISAPVDWSTFQVWLHFCHQGWNMFWGWIDRWMGGQEYKESIIAKQYLVPCNWVCHLKILPFLYTNSACLKLWAPEGLCCNCSICDPQHSTPSRAIGFL